MKKTLLAFAMAFGAVAEMFALSESCILTSPDGLTAYQSSSYDDGVNADAAAVRAIDGNTGGNLAGWNNGFLFDADGQQTTDNDAVAAGANWWMVDFGREIPVAAVKIFFEGAYAVDFDIEFFTTEPQAGAEASDFVAVTGNTGTAFEQEFDTAHSARYMRLRFKKATNAGWGIKFYEVQVFTRPEIASISLSGTAVSDRSPVVRGVPTPLHAFLYGPDGNLVDTNSSLSITCNNPAVTIDGTTVTASETGTYDFTVTFGGKEYRAAVNVVTPIDEMNCLVFKYMTKN